MFPNNSCIFSQSLFGTFLCTRQKTSPTLNCATSLKQPTVTMAATVKTVVATGASSGLGFHVIKHLLSQTSQPYRFILGARDVSRTQDAYRSAFPGAFLNPHSLEILPLELADLKTVKQFAKQTLEKLEGKRIDYLLLNAGITNGAGTGKPGPGVSKWCEALVVNHLSQHYLTHLLLPALVRSGSDGTDTTADSSSRIVVVSSGAIRRVTDPSTLAQDLQAGSGKDGNTVYAETKFVQLLGAHWWRRKLKETACKVVAVSPGLIPGTGIGRGSGLVLSMEMKDAKSVDEGAQSILRAFTRDDFPKDPDRIFLTSWGEWWNSETIGVTLDKELQDRWCPEKEEIETKEEGLKDL